MNNYCCQKLDDFLDGDLAPDEQKRFDEAVAQCDSCQTAIAQQANLDAALKSAWREVAPPAGLNVTADEINLPAKPQPEHAQRALHVAQAAIATILAASLFIAISTMSRNSGDSGAGGAATSARLDAAPSVARHTDPLDAHPAVITFDQRSIGVVDESSDDSFTLVRVYSNINVADAANN